MNATNLPATPGNESGSDSTGTSQTYLESTGLAPWKIGEQRVTADMKSIIRAKVDVNQLEPVKYKQPLEDFKNAFGNLWLPYDINMAEDIALLKSGQVSEDEQAVLFRALGFFAAADSFVGNNLLFGIYRHIKSPEHKTYLYLQMLEETVHTLSYQHIITSLGLDEGTIFNMYREVPAISKKMSWSRDTVDNLVDPNFEVVDDETTRELLRNLITFYVVMEGIFFYVGFSQVLCMKHRNMFKRTAEQFEYIMRDESNHCNFGIDVINTIRSEYPSAWTPEFETEVYEIIREGAELEKAYAFDTVKKPFLGFSAEKYAGQVEWITNRRLQQLSLQPIYNITESPMPELDEVINLMKEKNFFETTPTEYQHGGLTW